MWLAKSPLGEATAPHRTVINLLNVEQGDRGFYKCFGLCQPNLTLDFKERPNLGNHLSDPI